MITERVSQYNHAMKRAILGLLALLLSQAVTPPMTAQDTIGEGGAVRRRPAASAPDAAPAPASAGGANDELHACLEQVSTQADAFARIAPVVVGHEVMKQKALVLKAPPRGFSARPTDPMAGEFVNHEITTEYGFVNLKDEPGNYHELRQVIEADGKPVATPAKARKTLLAGMTSMDDKRKRQMLEELTKYGLVEVAVDFGQSLLLFQRAQIPNYNFKIVGQQQLNDEDVAVIEFEQQQGAGHMTLFEEGKTQSHALRGRLWTRKSDCLPVRVRLIAQRSEGNTIVSDEGTVDYDNSSFGALLPTNVIHRKRVNGKIVTETVSEFTGFQKYGSESQIEFPKQPQP